MNLQTFLLSLLLFGFFGAVVYRTLKKKKIGACGSCGHSTSCSLASLAEKRESCSVETK